MQIRRWRCFLLSWDINDEIILSDFTFLFFHSETQKLWARGRKNAIGTFLFVTWMEEAACVAAIWSWSAWPAWLFYWTELCDLELIRPYFGLNSREWHSHVFTVKARHYTSLSHYPGLQQQAGAAYVTHWSVWMSHKVDFFVFLLPFSVFFFFLGWASDNLL